MQIGTRIKHSVNMNLASAVFFFFKIGLLWYLQPVNRLLTPNQAVTCVIVLQRKTLSLLQHWSLTYCATFKKLEKDLVAKQLKSMLECR